MKHNVLTHTEAWHYAPMLLSPCLQSLMKALVSVAHCGFW